MLNAFPVSVFIGIVLGFLAGLGVGGGSLLMLWLTLVLDMEQTIARSINLLFFIPSALISCLFRKQQGSLDYKKLIPAMLCGIAAAATAGIFSKHFDIDLLKKMFGVLLLITGLRELFYRPRKAK